MWKKIVVILVLVGGGWWFMRYLARPAPGTKVPEMGREHVALAQVEKTTYNSNPPTSGPHYEVPSKPGIYDTPQHDGALIHSLEHGYVIISYNCGVHLKASSFQPLALRQVFAHEEEGATPAADLSSPIATGSAINGSTECQTLVKQLEELAQRKRLFKLIVVPRPQLDTTIALTAWGVIDKFDPPAGGFDAKRIERFIDYHRDHGPEKTME